MPTVRRTHVLIVAFLGCGTALPAGEIVPVPCLPPRLCKEQLLRMSRGELECLYRVSAPGPIPHGYAPGIAIRWPGTVCAVPNARVTGLLWHGKLFDECGTSLVNRWAGGRYALNAQVSVGDSWLDGGPSIIMDYRATSRAWRTVRDELRQVGPDLYLGIMFLDQCPQPKLKMFFALDVCPCE